MQDFYRSLSAFISGTLFGNGEVDSAGLRMYIHHVVLARTETKTFLSNVLIIIRAVRNELHIIGINVCSYVYFNLHSRESNMRVSELQL